uniref:Metaxin-2 n=1 Tax=Strongyloides papillosus TaxID=174720 RepID=A0A0N5B5G9_STREA
MTSKFPFTDAARDLITGKKDEPWADAKIYGSYSDTQGLLYENAEVFATRTLLRIANLPFHYEERPNAEFISNNGKVPILRLNNENKITCGFDEIYELIVARKLSLTDGIPDSQMADFEAYMAVVDETLKHCEMWMCWCDDKIFNETTSIRYGSVYHFPLNYALPRLRRWEVKRYLSKIGWSNKTLDEVVGIARNCFQTLSTKLGNNKYFFGDSPTQLDALVFGHIYCLLTTTLPNNHLMKQLDEFKNLEAFSLRIDAKYHKSKTFALS